MGQEGFEIDLTGEKFNMLTFLEFSHVKKNVRMWKCICDCGVIKVIDSSSIKRGKTKSCGCFRKAKLKTHGLCYHPLYNRWTLMKARCNNPTNKDYKDYGGRGITYCESWSKFENFYNDMIEGFEEHLEIDRIDNNGNYSKENCRWTTRSENCYNKRIPTRNTSSKTGVSYSHKLGLWVSYITKDYNNIYLGSFKDYKDAVEARVLAELDIYGYAKQ